MVGYSQLLGDYSRFLEDCSLLLVDCNQFLENCCLSLGDCSQVAKGQSWTVLDCLKTETGKHLRESSAQKKHLINKITEGIYLRDS